jgi:tetratricopeptide (TPR) repeat protein
LQAHEADSHAEPAEEENTEANSEGPGRAESAGRVLGTLSFPTTTQSAEAQQAFVQGMLLLHLFEYPFAREEFRRAQELDPEFAMAYWGEAMTFNHPIWDEQDPHSARAVLAALGATPDERLEKTPAAREKGFLAALEILYGPGTKAERDQAYMRAMEMLAAQFPDDHEVQLFYALSIFGTTAGVRNVNAYMMSTAIAESVFAENPRHPGAAHYLIHGVDDPVHAVLGLRAARALAEMAPDAGHSLHMTSHIFTALGMWDDMVAANESAVRVANAMREERNQPARNWGHYNFWLLYGYLQQGRRQEARDLLTAAYTALQEEGKAPADRMILDPDRSQVGSVVQMWARYLVETRDWGGEIAAWSFNMGDAFDPNLSFTFVQAMRAAESLQSATVATYVEQFRALKSELEELLGRQEEKAPGDLLYLQRLEVMQRLMLAAGEMSKGEKALAVRHASEASRMEGEMPFSFGPPFVDLPSAEMLGELLMSSRKFKEAAEAFETQLERSRQRSSTLLSLAMVQERLGKQAEAAYRRQKLEQIWRNADPEVKEAAGMSAGGE